MNVVIYARTSSKTQNINHQIGSLIKEAEKNNWHLLHLFKDEGFSGLIESREGLKDLKNFIKNNNVDKILVSEISRISRDTIFLKKFITKVSEKKISIFVDDFKYETLTNGKININMLNILFDQIKYSNYELEQTANRLRRGYNEYRSNGGKVGRKTGFKKSPMCILMENEEICSLLIKGFSVRNIMSITKKSSGTVQKVKKILIEQGYTFDTKVSSNDLCKILLENANNFDILKILNNK